MFFLMRCIHHPGQNSARDINRPAHRDWVQSGGSGLATVLIGSALIDEEGGSLGNFGLLEAPNFEAAEAFARGDPFNRAGIVAKIELIRLPDTFQSERISQPLTAPKSTAN